METVHTLEDWIFFLVKGGKKKEARLLATAKLTKGTALSPNAIKLQVREWIKGAEARVALELVGR